MSAAPKFPFSAVRYAQRFARVLEHIESRADGRLSLDELSEVAAFSRFHFQRQFSAFTGMSVSRYSQFMRMRRASWRLAFRPWIPVGDIALSMGYESPEAFARAFRQCSGQSPSEFRCAPAWPEWQSRLEDFSDVRNSFMPQTALAPTVRIVNFPQTRTAMLEHRGSPLLIGETIRKFIDWRRAHSLPPGRNATFNVAYSDMDDTPAEEFRFGLCVATDQAIATNDTGVREFVIPAGRCAVLRHTGSDDRLGQSVRRLYATWLPASAEEPRDFPLFMQRVAMFPDVPEAQAITDIFLPLA